MFDSEDQVKACLRHNFPEADWTIEVRQLPENDSVRVFALLPVTGTWMRNIATTISVADTINLLRVADRSAFCKHTKHRMWFTVAVKPRGFGRRPQYTGELFSELLRTFGDMKCLSSYNYNIVHADGQAPVLGQHGGEIAARYTFTRENGSEQNMEPYATRLAALMDYFQIKSTITVSELRRRPPFVLRGSSTVIVYVPLNQDHTIPESIKEAA